MTGPRRWCASSITKFSTRSPASRIRPASCSRCGGGSALHLCCRAWSKSSFLKRRRRAACTVDTNLRVVTLNFWGTEPPLERRIDLAVRQLRALAVDVVCMQEVRPMDGVSGRTTADVIAERLDMYAHYAK